MTLTNLDVLHGEVIRWRTEPKPDTGWHIVYVRDADGGEHTVTGCSLPRPGAVVELHGQWEDTRYGLQFHARSVAGARPALSADGVARWLATRVHGVGPAKALTLLTRYGGDAAKLWAALEAGEVPAADGVTADNLRAVRDALSAEGADGQYQALLHGWGMTQRQIQRVKQHWDLSTATTLLHQNPYLLADHVDGFGFRRADTIAEKIGIERYAPVRVRAALEHYIDAAAGEGHTFADRMVILQIARETRLSFDRLTDTIGELRLARRLIVEDGARVYTPELHAAETTVAADLRKRFEGYPRDARADWLDVDVRVVDGVSTDADPWQALAVRLLADERHPIGFVTGGPGTGKTRTLRQAIELLEARGHTVHLAAPTGKAAKRMTEATGRRAYTLHTLLGYRPAPRAGADDCAVCRDAESSFDYSRLPTEDALGVSRKHFIFVDESSMVDVRLWAALAQGGVNAHLRFIGDAQQLPPVGAGQPFRDALDVAPGDVVVRLRNVYRAKGEWVRAAAPAILAGATPALDPAPGLRFIEVPAADDIVAAVRGVFSGGYDDAYFNASAANAAGHMPVLVPQRTGRAGVAAINRVLHDMFNPAPDTELAVPLDDGCELRAGSWVMILKNDSRRGVCNGDTAYVTRVDTDYSVWLSVEGAAERGEVRYTRPEARELLRLAYASTVHKSQGSEYPWCAVVCHSIHKRMLTRRLLYTAITRAKEGVVLIGDREGITWAIDNTREVARCTWLANRVGSHHG